MKKGDIVQFKFKKRFRGQVFMIMSRRRKKPQWKAPKVKVMRVTDGQNFLVSITALEATCR